MNIKIWEIHPQACRVEHAEKTCLGSANKAGVQWCGPYSNANQTGFWLYSPIDMDFSLENGEFKVINSEKYSDEDYHIVKSLIKPDDNSNFEKWIFPNIGRTKTTFALVEKNVMQLWTGLIFQTPPGWCLQIRSPINFPYMGFNIVEAILETDWLQYDIWMNLSVTSPNSIIRLRKEFPIAHLVPIRRESFKAEWEIQREKINRDTPEAEEVFKYWIGYNKQKFEFGGKQQLSKTLTKDSTTYFKEKTRLIGKQMEPYTDVEKCPEPPKSRCPYSHLHSEQKEDFKEPKAKVEFEPLADNSFLFRKN